MGSSVYLVSACLLGMPLAYDGQGRLARELAPLVAQGRMVPVCPEVAGGLAIPRPCAEIVGGSGEDVLDGQARVVTADGQDVTAAYLEGAEAALATARRCGATKAVLKARSPSCGSSRIYDGSHTGRLVPGQGVAAALLCRAGLEIISEEELPLPLHKRRDRAGDHGGSP
jgi:uncharacterized protein YbbK (DUF523 family)